MGLYCRQASCPLAVVLLVVHCVCMSKSHVHVYDVLQLQVRKSELEKRKNDDEQEEGWVACDACGAWVHMICGLFNKGRNDDDMPYHCPNCLLTGECRAP